MPPTLSHQKGFSSPISDGGPTLILFVLPWGIALHTYLVNLYQEVYFLGLDTFEWYYLAISIAYDFAITNAPCHNAMSATVYKTGWFDYFATIIPLVIYAG